MKTLLFDASMGFAVVVCLICSTFLGAGQETGSNTAQSSVAESYPNTAAGLHSLITDLLAVAKGDNEAKVWSKIAEMEIPDYENWFRTMGKRRGKHRQARTASR